MSDDTKRIDGLTTRTADAFSADRARIAALEENREYLDGMIERLVSRADEAVEKFRLTSIFLDGRFERIKADRERQAAELSALRKENASLGRDVNTLRMIIVGKHGVELDPAAGA